METITADLLTNGDILDSHDEDVHVVTCLRFNDTTQRVRITVQKNNNPTNNYECELGYDDPITVLY